MGVCAGRGYVSTINAVVAGSGTLDDVYEEEKGCMDRRMRLVYQEAMVDPLTLRSINLSFSNLKTVGCYHLAKLLSFATNISTLRLWKCHLGLKGAEFLVLDLGSLHRLQVLGLEDNTLGLEGTLILAPVIGTLEQLQELYYHTNELEASGACALVKHLSQLKRLTVVTMDENRTGDEGLRGMMECLPLGSIQMLGLSHNCIHDEGVNELIRRADQLPNLGKIYIGGNKVSHEVLATLKSTFPSIQLL